MKRDRLSEVWLSTGVVGGGAALHQIFGGRVQHAMKKWTQWDLRFCKNEGSKRSKNCKKGDQQDRKSRRKLVQNASKWSNDRFL